MTDAPRPAGVTPPVAVVFATVTYVALAIGGLGVTGLLLDADVIPVTGLGAIPGVVGMLSSTAGFAGVLLWGLRARPPGYLTAVPCLFAAYVGEVVGIVVGAALAGLDPARGAAAAGSVALGWPAVVIVLAALTAGLLGVALVPSRGARPHWSWEGDDE